MKKKKGQKKSKKKSLKDHPKRELYIGIGVSLIVGLVIGLIIGIPMGGKTPEAISSEIQTYCNIDMQILYEKPCTATEDCYGRLELCSVTQKKCITTVQVDKTDPRNIRIPDTKNECEANGGSWEIREI